MKPIIFINIPHNISYLQSNKVYFIDVINNELYDNEQKFYLNLDNLRKDIGSYSNLLYYELESTNRWEI